MASTYQVKQNERNRFKGRSKGSPIAGNAVKGEPDKKLLATLKSRLAAWNASKGKSVGGHEHHKPGSMQGHLS